MGKKAQDGSVASGFGPAGTGSVDDGQASVESRILQADLGDLHPEVVVRVTRFGHVCHEIIGIDLLHDQTAVHHSPDPRLR